ncbi:MAG: hypothetical protein WBX19_19495 [Terracidiphilus sp.]
MRQGAVLPIKTVRSLGLKLDGRDAEPLAVVISHDCDLVSEPEDEPFVEIVLARPIDTLQAGCTHAQSTYKLHIEYEVQGADRPIELLAINKLRIRKEDLTGVTPDSGYVLSRDNLEILQIWLAARYRRASFPDDLVERLKPMREKIERIGKKATKEVLGIWISFEPTDNHLPVDAPYEIWISIEYSTRIEGAKSIADREAETLSLAFGNRYKVGDIWNLIELRRCAAYSETEFTLLDVLRSSQWRLEYISMKQSPPGEVV